MERSKFGNEHTHQCLLGKEPCKSYIKLQLKYIAEPLLLAVPHIQMTLASERIDQLNAISAADRNSSSEVFTAIQQIHADTHSRTSQMPRR